jgi:hypothetical protein
MTRDEFVSECFEKVYRPTDLISMTTDAGGVIDITLHDLLNTLGLTDGIVKEDLCLEYLYDGDEIDISEIRNNETNEVYWEDNGGAWSSIDETLMDSLLMWGEIE